MSGFTEDDREYIALIRQLPRPTMEQTALFASYITESHSWYKHLPLLPRVPFYLYLDPNAGKNIIQTHTGEIAVLEITDESSKFHYTWQTTKEYRERFGLWNYHSEYGSRFLIDSDGGVVSDPRDKGLQIFAPFSNQGAWIQVPLVLQELAQVNLSSIIHPSMQARFWQISESERNSFDRDYPIIPQTIAEQISNNMWQNLWWIFSQQSVIQLTPKLSFDLLVEILLTEGDILGNVGSDYRYIWNEENRILALMRTKAFEGFSFKNTLLILERARSLISLDDKYLGCSQSFRSMYSRFVKNSHDRVTSLTKLEIEALEIEFTDSPNSFVRQFFEKPEEALEIKQRLRVLLGEEESKTIPFEVVKLLNWIVESRMQQLEEMITAMNHIVESIYGLE
ncbi:hypothetical protein PseudUWO311_20060 [Pseudanabaena sp. UWO311]|uniref:hypothetical protein n=1 Tax=Pseudanabaena sp. UWO311 TaxID=2487337 RepID=UPI00115BB02F|nr:hypothetical protein [Pseudanabaena sp. UWO311]TYQ24194.1 hypothetical protein PseudUWO311_20060 [Pseudanabaena sp. UWO311]